MAGPDPFTEEIMHMDENERDYLLSPAASLLEAMRKIERNSSGMVLVTDEDEHLLGTLSDGDIRRALLKGATVQDAVEGFIERHFLAVSEGADRSEVLELMQARKINQVPVLDRDGRVAGLHLLRQFLNRSVRENAVIIMAGGMGSRLGTLTARTPKPLLKVAGRPILERLILRLMGYGFTELFLAVNHFADQIEAYFGDGAALGCRIRYLREDKPLGSGGALALLPEMKLPVLALNGDLVVEADFARMLDFHCRHGFYATMGTHLYTHEVPFGCVESCKGRMSALEEKPLVTKEVNAGIYVLSPEALRDVPRNVFFPMTNLFENALANEKPCGVFQLTGDWIDVGRPEELKRARGMAADGL